MVAIITIIVGVIVGGDTVIATAGAGTRTKAALSFGAVGSGPLSHPGRPFSLQDA
jgi:hypothetical protein